MKAPAFQLYADDFLGGTSDMTQAEIGAYILLLCNQWNRGYVPVETERQQLIARGDVSAHVLAKFELCEDGVLRNERLELERQKQADFRAKQQQKGLASAKVRWGKKSNRGVTGVVTAVEPSVLPKGNSPSPISYNTPIVPTGDKKPVEKGPIQLRAEKLMRRRPDTPLTVNESRALRKNRDAMVSTSEQDWLHLEAFYAAPQEETYARKDFATLVNNWNGEIDRARAWAAKKQPTASYRILE